MSPRFSFVLALCACQPRVEPAPPRPEPGSALAQVPAPTPTPAPAPTPPPSEPTPVVEVPAVQPCQESLDGGETRWRGRALSTGLLPGPSSLEIWALGRTKDRATLVIHELRAAKAGPPADDQPEGTWTCVRSVAYEGTVTGTTRLQLRLATPAGETRELACTPRTVRVANATARRIRVASKSEECNASRWAPATTRARTVLACADPTDRYSEPFFLAALPGIEHVTYDNDDCGDGASALRAIAADGAIAPVMRISEQPAAFVPAHLRRTK